MLYETYPPASMPLALQPFALLPYKRAVQNFFNSLTVPLS